MSMTDQCFEYPARSDAHHLESLGCGKSGLEVEFELQFPLWIVFAEL